MLDVATGTGWGARQAARYGAKVHGVDFAGELIEAARLPDKEAGLEIGRGRGQKLTREKLE